MVGGRPNTLPGTLRRVTDEYLSRPATSRWHDGVTVGERYDADELLAHPLVPLEELRLEPLAPMLVPEEPRSGVLDPSECWHCPERGRDRWIWTDEHWHVVGAFNTGLPWLVGLAPNAHLRLDELGPGELATLGTVIQRLAGAVQGLKGVARTHFARWGDGSAHFHMSFSARPLGMMQARGWMLQLWDDVLPRTDAELLAEHNRQVAAALAEGGGEALV